MEVVKVELTLVAEVPLRNVNNLIARMSHHIDEFIDMETLKGYDVDAITIKNPAIAQMPIYNKYVCSYCGANLYPPEDKAYYCLPSHLCFCEECTNAHPDVTFLPIPEDEYIGCGVHGKLYMSTKSEDNE